LTGLRIEFPIGKQVNHDQDGVLVLITPQRGPGCVDYGAFTSSSPFVSSLPRRKEMLSPRRFLERRLSRTDNEASSLKISGARLDEDAAMTLKYVDMNKAILANAALQKQGVDSRLKLNVANGAEPSHRLQLPFDIEWSAIDHLDDFGLLGVLIEDE
jgi:hypothetical protein